MRDHRIRLVGALTVAATTALFGIAVPASAQTVDVAGTWALEVTTSQGVATPSFTLEQEGEGLTGHYSSEALGEADLTGTVSGSEVTISFTASVQGQSVPVVYRGTIDEDGQMSGTIDLAGGALTGTFTASRSDPWSGAAIRAVGARH